MAVTRAFDLALFVPVPANVNDGVVVSALGPPFATTFKPVVTSVNPGVTVSASIPAANAQGQILVAGPSPNFAWSLGVQTGGGGGGVQEAPMDGLVYGRQWGAWVLATTSGGVPDAPNDGASYVRQNGAWTSIWDAGTF